MHTHTDYLRTTETETAMKKTERLETVLKKVVFRAVLNDDEDS